MRVGELVEQHSYSDISYRDDMEGMEYYEKQIKAYNHELDLILDKVELYAKQGLVKILISTAFSEHRIAHFREIGSVNEIPGKTPRSLAHYIAQLERQRNKIVDNIDFATRCVSELQNAIRNQKDVRLT